MKSKLYWFWYKVMSWESKRLLRKTNKQAEKLAKMCEKQTKHNNRLAEFETIVLYLLNK